MDNNNIGTVVKGLAATAVLAGGLALGSYSADARSIVAQQQGNSPCRYITQFYSDKTWSGGCRDKAHIKGGGTWVPSGNNIRATTTWGKYWEQGTNTYSRVRWLKKQ